VRFARLPSRGRPVARQVCDIDPETSGVGAHRAQIAAGFREAELLHDLAPAASEGDRVDQLTIRPAALAGEVGMVDAELGNASSHRALRSGRRGRPAQGAEHSAP
jgi:hypothetical protein